MKVLLKRNIPADFKICGQLLILTELGICCHLHMSYLKCMLIMVDWLGMTEHKQQKLSCVYFYFLGVILLYISCEMIFL